MITGNAMLKDDESRAAANVIMQMEEKANMKRLLGLNFVLSWLAGGGKSVGAGIGSIKGNINGNRQYWQACEDSQERRNSN